MNYSFISTGIPFPVLLAPFPAGFATSQTRYSPRSTRTNLDETLGINAGTTDITVFSNDFVEGIGAATGPIDWNLNGPRPGERPPI